VGCLCGLLREGKLAERICVLWYAGTTLASAREALAQIQAQPRPPQSLGDGRLLSCGAKIFMDGSGGARTAWLYRDWNKNSTVIDSGNSGYPALDPESTASRFGCFTRPACTSEPTRSATAPSIGWSTRMPRC